MSSERLIVLLVVMLMLVGCAAAPSPAWDDPCGNQPYTYGTDC